jgi:hypothetical protein
MANKTGILNGILLLILNFLASIPLGIYFSLGISSYAGIPLFFAQNGSYALYTWGLVDILSSEGTWWINLGIPGITGLILEIFLILSSILTFIGSWIEKENGKKLMGAILIIEIICFAFIFVDILVIGSLGFIISFSELPNSLGIGTYFLLIIILLQIITIKTHKIKN